MCLNLSKKTTASIEHKKELCLLQHLPLTGHFIKAFIPWAFSLIQLKAMKNMEHFPLKSLCAEIFM